MDRSLVSLYHSTCLLVLLTTGCAQGDASRDRGGSDDLVRNLVAAQATSEFGVWAKSHELVVRPEDVHLEPGPPVGPAVRIVRAIPPRDHWHPYMVAVKDTFVYALGGFSAPELPLVAALLRESPGNDRVTTLARTLAIIADDEGAVRSFMPGQRNDSGEARVAAAWERVKPLNWPADTVLHRSAGGQAVRLTLISQQTRSYDLGWKATVFDFQFDAEANLISWSRRAGDKFAASSR